MRSRFIPTGKMVAAAGLDKSIRIWELEERSGRLLQSQIAHEDAILELAWSPDGSTLISASADKTIKVFKAPELTEIKTIARQSDWTYGLEFAPDGKTFAAGRYDGSLSIYEMNGFRDHCGSSNRIEVDHATYLSCLPTAIRSSGWLPKNIPYRQSHDTADINVVAPRGVARGTTVELTVEGLNLANAQAILFDQPGIKGRIVRVKELPDLPDIRLGSNGTPSTVDLGPLPPRNQVTVELDIDADAKIGPVGFRLQTPLGTSPKARS